MRKNNKGFTLIELIVTIAIMGILMLIALPQVQKLQRQNSTKKYEIYKKSLTSAAKLYIDSYKRDLFGNEPGGCKLIKYSELKNANLIKDFQDSNITCADDEETYVKVMKLNDEYQYSTSIICRKAGDVVFDQHLDGSTCSDASDSAPIITVTPDKNNGWQKSGDIDINIKISGSSYGLNSNTAIKYRWKDTRTNQFTNYYYKNFKNNKGINSVGFTIPKANKPTGSGKYLLLIEPYEKTGSANGVQSSLGNKVVSETQSGPYQLDNVKPECGTITGESTTNTWVNTSRTITVACNDKNGSGCQKNSYTKTYNSGKIETDEITISDNVGNTNTCKVNVRVDITKLNCPTIKSSVKTSTWTNKDITFTLSNFSKDTVKYRWYTQINNTTQKTDNVYVREANKSRWDSWGEKKLTDNKQTISAQGRRRILVQIEDATGHTKDCGYDDEYLIDKTAPTLTINAYERTYNSTTKKEGKTGGSVATRTVNNKTKKGSIFATKDYANNVHVDGWLKTANFPKGVYYELIYSDDLSGLATRNWTWNSTGLLSSNSKASTLSNSNGGKATNISGKSGTHGVSLSGDGYRKGKVEITDKAGNEVEIEISVGIDREAPTKPTVTLYQWKDNNGARPTSNKGLSVFTGSTSTKKIFSQASGSTDKYSGLDHYVYTTTGTTKNQTSNMSYRTIESNGKSTISYKACDKAGNCSASMSKTVTINTNNIPEELSKKGLTNCSIRGNKIRYMSNRPNAGTSQFKCSAGHWHSTYFQRYCWDSSKKQLYEVPSGSGNSPLICPTDPYREPEWVTINDKNYTSKNKKTYLTYGVDYTK